MIRLPVSIGEALDKLTILDIKLEKIKDPAKKAYCQQEYDLLATELEPHLKSHPFQYAKLREVNLDIWMMQDEIRVRPDPQKCVEILDKNDMRFRLKDVVNQSARSFVREQKGYPQRVALVIGHMGIGDHIGLVGAVRYIAMRNDETVVVCKRGNAETVATFFADDPTIKLWVVDGAYTKMPTGTSAGEVVPISSTIFTSVYRSGFYAYPRSEFEDFPRGFYRDMGLDPAVRHTHFHVPTTDDAKALLDSIGDQPYIFVQQKSSDQVTPLVTWDPDTILTIDPNLNVYPEDHRWYALAQSCIDRPFLSYTLLLQNATEVHTVDSAFYCLACYLPLTARVKRCYARGTGVFIPSYPFK